MFDHRAFWAAVRAEEEKIEEPFVHIMSLEDKTRGMVGGRVIHVTRRDAAQQIVNKSARLATPEEIAAVQPEKPKKAK